MRLTQDKRFKTDMNGENPSIAESVGAQQRRYFSFCNNNTQSFSKKKVTLPKFKCLEDKEKK